MTIPYMIALSTSWCSKHHDSGYDMLEEIANLGFKYVQLGHNIRMQKAPGILRAVDQGIIKVAAIHNFCPVPSHVSRSTPNFYQPSSSSRRQRQHWVRQTKHTIDFAKKTLAKTVICHMGSADFWIPPQKKLEKLANNRVYLELLQDIKYQRALLKILKSAQKKEAKATQRSHSCLNQLLAKPNEVFPIKVAIKNRSEVYNYPLDNHICQFLERTKDNSRHLGYWHDTGHAKLKEQMGLLNHKRHLEKTAHTILGFNLHDVTLAGREHRALGRGMVDFKMVRSFIQPHHILTLDFSSRVKKQEVIDSRKYLEDLLG